MVWFSAPRIASASLKDHAMNRLFALVFTLAALACVPREPHTGPDHGGASSLPPSVQLAIPDRLQGPGAPPEGWCAEACIQMALGHFKQDVSQKVINAAGRPAHPDLRDKEINIALDALQIDYDSWNRRTKDLPKFLAWIKANLAKGYPVLCGIKMYPDRHPDWSVDHYVLVVGYDEKGLRVNTNHKGVGQVLLDYEKLATPGGRYSFANNYNSYFGMALKALH